MGIVAILVFLVMPFGAGFGLAYWPAGRDFRALLKTTERAIELLEQAPAVAPDHLDGSPMNTTNPNKVT